MKYRLSSGKIRGALGSTNWDIKQFIQKLETVYDNKYYIFPKRYADCSINSSKAEADLKRQLFVI